MERPQFILFIEPTRPEMPDAPTPDEASKVGEHFRYLQDQLASGNLILAGRALDTPSVGIAIFEAADEVAAAAFAANDPAIQAGVFRLVRIQRYHVALIRH